MANIIDDILGGTLSLQNPYTIPTPTTPQNDNISEWWGPPLPPPPPPPPNPGLSFSWNSEITKKWNDNSGYNSPPPGPAQMPGATAGGGPGAGGAPGGSIAPGQRGAVSAAPSPFDEFTGPAIDAAQAIVHQFLGLLGYPRGADAQTMMLHILRNHLVDIPQIAIQSLFDVQATGLAFWGISQEVIKNSPWARFGLNGDDWRARTTKANDAFRKMLGVASLDHRVDPKTGEISFGSDPFLSNIYHDMLIGKITESEAMLQLKGNQRLVEMNPWIGIGQTYESTQNQYTSIYGAPPVSTEQLSTWFKYNTAARTIQAGAGGPLSVNLNRQLNQGSSEIR